MFSTARAVLSLVSLLLPIAALSQTGPADPQVIAAASTAKVNVGNKKLTGQMLANVRVGEDGRVREVQVTENTAEAAFESQLTKVLQSARFRPAIDASGKPVEASVEMKVELRVSTAAEPKPVAAKPDPQLTDKEKARIKKMRCADFVWEWDLLRDGGRRRGRHRIHAAHRDHDVCQRPHRGRRLRRLESLESGAEGAEGIRGTLRRKPAGAVLGRHLQDRHGRSRSEVNVSPRWAYLPWGIVFTR